jgi:hypothetical protein
MNKRREKMKNRTLMLMLMLFALLISCTTTTKVVDVNDNADYVALKEKYVKMIEENLKSDAQINLDNYLVGAGDIIGSRFGYYSVYMQDFRNTFRAYRPIVDKHNEDVFARQRELRFKDIQEVGGSADWLDFQRRYSVENFYREILSRNPGMMRYAIEVFGNGIQDYRTRNPTMTQEQDEWVKHLMFRIFEIGLYIAASDEYETYRVVRAKYNDLLAFKRGVN